MAPHSSTLAWKIPWTEEPGGLQSMGSLRVGHDWATSLYFSLSCIGEGNGNPLQWSCLENLRDGGAWWAAIYGVTQSRTRLKRHSSSSTHMHTTLWRVIQKAYAYLSGVRQVWAAIQAQPSTSCVTLLSPCIRHVIYKMIKDEHGLHSVQHWFILKAYCLK